MKKKEYVDLKSKTKKELEKLVTGKKAEALKKKAEEAAGKDKNIKGYRNLRLEIARILTLIKEKEILEKVEKKDVKEETK